MNDSDHKLQSSIKRAGLTAKNIRSFQNIINHYYQKFGRKLPWRETKNPFAILVSELMLQQTQVDRVLPKYQQFLNTFPDFQSLASATFDQVLQVWHGLGYNRRALFLHKLAQKVITNYQGILPNDENTLRSLPGIGPYTAAAIQTFTLNIPTIFIETNIRTVYLYFFFSNQERVSDSQILTIIRKTLPKEDPRHWYYALMDYGSMLKKTIGNLNQRSAHYTKQSPYQGSNRQMRSHILKLLLQKTQTIEEIINTLSSDPKKITEIIKTLEKEDFVIIKRNLISLKK